MTNVPSLYWHHVYGLISESLIITKKTVKHYFIFGANFALNMKQFLYGKFYKNNMTIEMIESFEVDDVMKLLVTRDLLEQEFILSLSKDTEIDLLRNEVNTLNSQVKELKEKSDNLLNIVKELKEKLDIGEKYPRIVFKE